jgi:hypothetical protein
MIINNKTDYSSHFIRNMVLWVAKKIDLSTRDISKADFFNYSGAYRGRCWFRERRFNVRIGSDKFFPRTPHIHHGIPCWIETRIQALVLITAHEMVHIDQATRPKPAVRRTSQDLETECERRSRDVLLSFLENQEELLQQWNTEPASKKKVASKKSATEIREARARELLKTWERKHNLAKKKVAAYRTKVAYYEKKKAAVK